MLFGYFSISCGLCFHPRWYAWVCLSVFVCQHVHFKISNIYACGVQVTSLSSCWMTLTKDFACLQCKFHPTWRKYLCPLNLMGVVAHHLYTSICGINVIAQGQID